ncbi:spermidine synthase [Paraburkholderia sp. DHOC27]|nr:fused MFS/spermidine synthase [Paraburkholderia sp. DHOC27]RFU49839.1 spermidine synthase [Paraburkholderia sp. DHOC27]
MLLLLVSGAASLIYQLLWIKQLSLVVGVEVQAVTIGISGFFAGMALGGWLFGKLADRSARPLLLYAALEGGALLLALACTFGLAHAALLFVTLQKLTGPLAWALPFALVGVPAILMGGTLPVLMRALAPRENLIGHAGARLYAANTAGAIAGTLVAPFVLIPWLGVQGAACAAAVLNCVAMLAALLLAPGGRARVAERAFASVDARSADDTSPTAHQAHLALVIYALAGGIGLGYEVIWSQTIVQFIGTRSFAFAVVLATYLLGLALGSALVARRVDRARDAWGSFGLLIAAAGVVALVELAVLGQWLPRWQADAAQAVMNATGNLLATMCARFAVASLAIVFVPTVLLGAAFPFALRLTVHARRTGRDVGAVVALNTAGGIAGSLLAGFVLLPALGLIHALAALAILASVLGLLAVFGGHAMQRGARWGVPLLAALAVIASILTPADRLAAMLATAHGGALRFYEESAGGTVAVIEQTSGDNHFNRLYIQGVSNSGDAMTSLRYMRMQALLPLLIHRDTPRSVLVIGLGTGITSGALLTWPGLEQRVVAELLPAVVRASAQFKGNYGVTNDPRVQIRLHDGRHELLSSTQRYDLITLEPPPPSAAGIVNLYSSDFYRLAASRLNDGGLVAQWLPLATQNEADTRSLIKSFVQTFPYATLWTTELHEMMLVGSMQPITLDLPGIRARFAQPEVAKALGEVGIASPAALMSTWVTDRAGLEYYAADAPEVTDDKPRIEYAKWVDEREFPRVLARLLALHIEPPVVGADDAFRAAMQTEQGTLQTFYKAALDAYQGDRGAWQDDIARVMQADGDNPYYRWFVGMGG